ncbi:MAG TPA: hypothetical protein ENI11_00630 [Actinobacteria bacterium]|nr:hypothetical protein [Actinomycetota bacterium]
MKYFLPIGVDKAVKTNSNEIPSVKQAVDELFKGTSGDQSGCSNTSSSARIAIYESSSPAPRVMVLEIGNHKEFLRSCIESVFDIVREQGGFLPMVAIKEIVENLVHTDFQGVVVSIMDEGNRLSVSDHGPGISEKKFALEPGFSTAGVTEKALVRGVGSGLAVATQAMAAVGGTLDIQDNLDKGTVATLAMPKKSTKKRRVETDTPRLRLSKRQKKVLFIVVELGAVGPSRIADELSAGLSTAYRDLRLLESAGLIKCDKNGKRTLTDHGINSLDTIISS